MKTLFALAFASVFVTCNCHFLDDYFAIGDYLPEIWHEFPFMGYFEYYIRLPYTPTRGNSPSAFTSTTAYPTPTNALDGLTCYENWGGFRFWWDGPFFGSFDSISIVMHVKQPDGHGPIWSDSTDDGKSKCYIAHGYEEETGRLDEVLSKHRVHA